ncbi:hypothetical protein HGP14_12550 [Rhizobium sp. P32RR-XVIII]|nr:hypothetical protein [Rhizobium sp. P32RR-XVIII]
MAGIAAVKAAGHLVAVAVHTHHWDANWLETPEWMLELCRGLIDNGADIILGTGAPVMQPISFHRGKAIIPASATSSSTRTAPRPTMRRVSMCGGAPLYG